MKVLMKGFSNVNKKQLKIISQIRFTCPVTKKKISCRKDSKISTLLCDEKITQEEAIRMLKICNIRHNLTKYDSICKDVYNILVKITDNSNLLYNLTKDIARGLVDIEVYNIFYNKYKSI